jgi:uroporphyrinogen-III synthase
MAALEGLSILVPESRELDLFGAMLEGEGASVLRCPLVQILDLEDRAQADAWIDRLITEPFDDLVLLTGEGLRRLLALCGLRRERFIAALGKVRTVTRGPKPARALREIGLSPSLAAPVPTSLGVLDSLAAEDLRGRRMGVQLYPGDGTALLMDSLCQRGVTLFPVTPYRYASQADTVQVVDVIRALASGAIGMIAFTATPQIERLFAVARERGLETELATGLKRTPIAAIGPVVEQTLAAHGLASAIQPQSSFHLKPLVRAIIGSRACA